MCLRYLLETLLLMLCEIIKRQVSSNILDLDSKILLNLTAKELQDTIGGLGVCEIFSFKCCLLFRISLNLGLDGWKLDHTYL